MNDKIARVKLHLKGEPFDDFEEIVKHIKNLERLNKQLKDKVMFEKEKGLVDYTKLKSATGRISGEEWIYDWRKTYNCEPELT